MMAFFININKRPAINNVPPPRLHLNGYLADTSMLSDVIYEQPLEHLRFFATLTGKNPGVEKYSETWLNLLFLIFLSLFSWIVASFTMFLNVFSVLYILLFCCYPSMVWASCITSLHLACRHGCSSFMRHPSHNVRISACMISQVADLGRRVA